MRTMVYAGLMTIAFVLPHMVSLADEASHRQAAEGLLTVIEAAQDIQESADHLLENLLKQHIQLVPHKEAVKTFVTKHMNWASLKEDVITLYVEAFTEDELKQLTTFYHSPIGQKAVDKMPQLATAGTQIGLTRLRAHSEELRQIISTEPKKPE